MADDITLIELGATKPSLGVEGPPLGAAYRLTESGMALRPALQELSWWAGVHLTSGADRAAV